MESKIESTLSDEQTLAGALHAVVTAVRRLGRYSVDEPAEAWTPIVLNAMSRHDLDNRDRDRPTRTDASILAMALKDIRNAADSQSRYSLGELTGESFRTAFDVARRYCLEPKHGMRPEPRFRIEHCPNSTGLNWFLDHWIEDDVGAGWKNLNSYRTEDEAVTARDGTKRPLKPEEKQIAPTLLYPLSREQHATMLAALRFYEEKGQGNPANRSDAIHDIATNGDDVVSLDDGGIDELIEHLQFSGQPPVRVLVTVSGGIADYVSDAGADVIVFDHDDYRDDPEGTGGVPDRFLDLAAPIEVPVGDDTGLGSSLSRR